MKKEDGDGGIYNEEILQQIFEKVDCPDTEIHSHLILSQHYWQLTSVIVLFYLFIVLIIYIANIIGVQNKLRISQV